MSLKIYDTARRQKVDFIPANDKAVSMYVCGPTVYDYIHIGNARPLVVFDVFYRLLRHIYGQSHVKYARNITDVDDKINARAAKTGETIREITDRTNKQFQADAQALGCLNPDVQPRATEHIPEMIAMIQRLIDNGYAYEAAGHVLFRTTKWAAYGKFANRDQDELIAGLRVDVADYKENESDFVLWKPSADAIPGWNSPWGRGRPGWHIECSAMSEKHLGKTFDIHGGGLDLIFPHHQNEIAQSCCANPGAGFAKYWMHNGYLMSEGEKMSKSLGNFYTVRELLEEFPGEVLRLVILQTNYRAPLDFSKAKCVEAKAMLDRFYAGLRAVAQLPVTPAADAGFLASLCDDLNSAQAFAFLHEALGDLNKTGNPADKADAKSRLLGAGALLGLLQTNPENWFKGTARGDMAVDIEILVAKRKQAKAERDFATADALRQELANKGIILEDKPGGITEWRQAREKK